MRLRQASTLIVAAIAVLSLALRAGPVLAAGSQQGPGNPLPPPAMGSSIDAWIPVVALLVILAIGFLIRATVGTKS